MRVWPSALKSMCQPLVYWWIARGKGRQRRGARRGQVGPRSGSGAWNPPTRILHTSRGSLMNTTSIFLSGGNEFTIRIITDRRIGEVLYRDGGTLTEIECYIGR